MTDEPNWDELFKSIREDRSTTYTILTALRGPDQVHVSSDEVGFMMRCKQVVTFRLRAIVWPGLCIVGQLLRYDLELMVRQMAPLVANRRISEYNHFLQHLVAAVEVSRNHPIWGKHAQALMTCLLVQSDRQKFQAWFETFIKNEDHEL